MKTPKLICNICKQPLTRRWNAKRHCITKHDGIFDSIVPFSDYMRLTTTTMKMYPYISNQDVYSSKINGNQLPYQKNPFFQIEPSTIPNPLDFRHGRTIKEDIKVDDFTKREKLLSDKLDKIAPKYEEIENILSTSYSTESEEKSILGSIVCRAIVSDNPIRFMNNCIRDLRRTKFHNVMLENASMSLGWNKQTTKEYLKNLLKEDITD
ncbi:MAG: hypothetical protein AB7F53_04810 [Nitrososphaeraceae archaeon]